MMGEFECDKCYLRFKVKSKLKTHILRHLGFVCPKCNILFKTKALYLKHKEKHFIKCPECPATFSYKSNLKLHIIHCHRHLCATCGDYYLDFCSCQEFTCKCGGQFNCLCTDVCEKCGQSKCSCTTHKKQALEKVFTEEIIFPTEDNFFDLSIFLDENRNRIKTTLDSILPCKWYLSVKCEFYKVTSEEVLYIDPFFNSVIQCLLNKDQIEEQINSATEYIKELCATFTSRGSGWVYLKTIFLKLSTAEFKPLSASSYIPTPKLLASCRSLINIKNRDMKCFLYCILAHILPRQSHPSRVNYYVPYETLLTMTGIEFPVSLTDIKKFEKLNPYSVNVFAFDDKDIYPLRISTQRQRDVINLLMLTNENGQHYCLIKNFNQLINHLHKRPKAYKYCMYCLSSFADVRCLRSHEEYCKEHECQKIVLPKVGKNLMKFNKHHHSIRVPYTIYCDWECLFTSEDKQSKNTHFFNSHTPTSFSYIIIDPYGKVYKEARLHRGNDCMQVFFDNLLKDKDEIMKLLKTNDKIKMTREDEIKFASAEFCEICNTRFGPGVKKYRDHDHLTSAYRMALCNSCNLHYKVTPFIPVLCHNLRNYDGHLILKYLTHVAPNAKISCIPSTGEQYLSFSIDSLRFLDSFQFLSSSLDNLVENLKLSNADFPITKHFFPDENSHQFVLRKGVFCYSYITSHEKYLEPSLPEKHHFYNELTKTHISDEDYTFALEMFNFFQLDSIGAYNDLYLRLDTYLLGDVMEYFRNTSLQKYKIDPLHYYSLPGFSLSACLKMTGAELELLTDIDQLLFIEKGLRGGFTCVSKRHVQANNPYMKDYDPSKPNSYILYADYNNLYAAGLRDAIPYKGFRWLSPTEVEKFDVMSVPEESSVGYIMEVTLSYPVHLHKDHEDFCLAVEKSFVSYEELSPYQKTLLNEIDIPYREDVKLLGSLKDKLNYVVHYKVLQTYLKLGMVLVETHKVLTFEQAPIFRKYLDFNTEARKNSVSLFEKNFYKLCNNSLFGKSLEQTRKHKNIRFVRSVAEASKLITKPNFKEYRIINENLVAIHLTKTRVELDKPLYIGFTVLDLSKNEMVNFLYNVMKKKYHDRVKVCYSDTDSFVMEIFCEDLYSDLIELKPYFDFSNYPKSHFLFDDSKKAQIGLMKDEFAGKIIRSFVGLRPKLYAIVTEDEYEEKKAKGVSKSVVRNELTFQDYYNVLLNSKDVYKNMIQFRSINHTIYTINSRKVALRNFDSKRYILPDGINTLPFGSCLIHEL